MERLRRTVALPNQRSGTQNWPAVAAVSPCLNLTQFLARTMRA